MVDEMTKSRRAFLGSMAAAAGALAAPRDASARGKWEFVDRSAGITITRRWEKDRQYPTLRGTGRIRCDPWDIVAVVQDAERHIEWIHECGEAKSLKRIDPHTGIVYNRTDVPWPSKDRDAIIRGKVYVLQPDVELRLRFNAISSQLVPRRSGVIRMPALDGHWYMVKMGENNTLVEYQLNADPGGELPVWLVERSSRDLPLMSIVKMRKQVKRTKPTGVYDDFIAKARAFQPG